MTATILRRLAAAGTLLAATAAQAHHAMDGQTPQTFGQGFLSGLAHPVIGLDHLAFVLAVGWLLARFGLGLRALLAAAFVTGSVVGTALHLRSVDLPASELLVALSVLIAGLALALRRLPGAGLLWVALPVAGVLHGYAYGESIVGAESTPLYAYLAGFVLIQFAIVTGVATLLARWEAPRIARGGIVAGALVALLGVWFTVAQAAALAG